MVENIEIENLKLFSFSGQIHRKSWLIRYLVVWSVFLLYGGMILGGIYLLDGSKPQVKDILDRGFDFGIFKLKNYGHGFPIGKIAIGLFIVTTLTAVFLFFFSLFGLNVRRIRSILSRPHLKIWQGLLIQFLLLFIPHGKFISTVLLGILPYNSISKLNRTE